MSGAKSALVRAEPLSVVVAVLERFDQLATRAGDPGPDRPHGYSTDFGRLGIGETEQLGTDESRAPVIVE